MANVTDDYMIGPTSELRIKLQVALLSILLCFGIVTNGSMLTLFGRFKRLRTLTNYLLIDLTIVEFLDVVVNIPIFMEFFLLTKKKNLDRQTRWLAMFFHRFFLINDLFTQLVLSFDCFLAIMFGRRFTGKKTNRNVIFLIVCNWMTILVLLLAFSIPNYKSDEEIVSDEAYQRLLFGPSQIIWKAVIPSFQAVAVVLILMTNFLIIKSRNDVSVRYGMKVFGGGIKNNGKAVNTLFIIMAIQTVCKVPASVYSYIAVDDRVEGNRWFAFMSYFCLFLSSSIMPVIYFTRSEAFKRSLVQIRKHPFARNAYLDFAAHHGYTHHRNGRLFIKLKKKKPKEKISTTPIGIDPEITTKEQERTKASSSTRTTELPTDITTKQSSFHSTLAKGSSEVDNYSQQSLPFQRLSDDEKSLTTSPPNKTVSGLQDITGSAQIEDSSRRSEKEVQIKENDTFASLSNADSDEGKHTIKIFKVQIHHKDSEKAYDDGPSQQNIVTRSDSDPSGPIDNSTVTGGIKLPDHDPYDDGLSKGDKVIDDFHGEQARPLGGLRFSKNIIAIVSKSKRTADSINDDPLQISGGVFDCFNDVPDRDMSATTDNVPDTNMEEIEVTSYKKGSFLASDEVTTSQDNLSSCADVTFASEADAEFNTRL